MFLRLLRLIPEPATTILSYLNPFYSGLSWPSFGMYENLFNLSLMRKDHYIVDMYRYRALGIFSLLLIMQIFLWNLMYTLKKTRRFRILWRLPEEKTKIPPITVSILFILPPASPNQSTPVCRTRSWLLFRNC